MVLALTRILSRFELSWFSSSSISNRCCPIYGIWQVGSGDQTTGVWRCGNGSPAALAGDLGFKMKGECRTSCPEQERCPVFSVHPRPFRGPSLPYSNNCSAWITEQCRVSAWIWQMWGWGCGGRPVLTVSVLDGTWSWAPRCLVRPYTNVGCILVCLSDAKSACRLISCSI